MITSYTKSKLPHFFIYAKNKEKFQVEPINNSVVNRLERIIPNPVISFRKAELSKFDYKMLQKRKNVNLNNADAEAIIDKYKELDLKKRFVEIKPLDSRNSSSDGLYVYEVIRKQILEVNDDIDYVVDVLVEYLYNHKKSSYKTTLWSSFGDILVRNLKCNVKTKYIYCKRCGNLTESKNNKTKYCPTCAKEVDRKKARERMKKIRCSK